MTTGQSTRPLSNVSLAPAPLAALLAATLLGGAMIGAAITLQFGSPNAAAAIGAPPNPPRRSTMSERRRAHGILFGSGREPPQRSMMSERRRAHGILFGSGRERARSTGTVAVRSATRHCSRAIEVRHRETRS